MKIFSQSRAPQCLPRILLDKLVKGFLALFPGRKKVQRSRAPRGRNWVPSRAHGRHELSWGLFGGTTWGAASSPLLLRSKSGASWSASLVHPLTQWFGAAAGADCAWLPVGHGGFWKNFLFYVPFAALFAPGKLGLCLRPRIFQSFGVWVLTLEYVVFGDACFTWFNSGYMFYERLFGELDIFTSCGELRSEAFTLHSAEWRSVHS